MRIMILFFCLYLSTACACTGIRLQARDGSVVFARTLEFGMGVIPFNMIVVPRGIEYQGTTPDGKNGMKWKVKYAFAGANPFDYKDVIDGLNEKGLAVGLFYFPEYADYNAYTKKDAFCSIAPWELGTFLLSQFQTVEEVKEHIEQIKVVPVQMPQLAEILPIHAIVHDKKGGCIVLEYIDGKLNIWENPLGVFTNSPTFDWHMTNLRNYINLTAYNLNPIDLAGKKFSGFGQGTGMIGLPGDFTPPSRFVRAAALSETHIPAKDAAEALFFAFHILNSFDIPVGAVREKKNGITTYEYTQFTSASDLSFGKYFIRTYGDMGVRSISLDQFNLDQGPIKWISMKGKEKVQDISDQAINFPESSL